MGNYLRELFEKEERLSLDLRQVRRQIDNELERRLEDIYKKLIDAKLRGDSRK